MNKIIILILTGIFFLLKGYTTFTVYEILSFEIFIYFLSEFVKNLGKRLVILDVIILSSIFLCLIMPITGYHHFNSTNRLARLWLFHMRVPTAQYYSYMFPATVVMIIGIKLPGIYKHRVYQNHQQYMTNVKIYLADKKWQGLLLVAIGITASGLQNYVPSFLSTPFSLLKYVMFVGVFYCLYSDLPNKRIILLSVFSLLIIQSISQGMFGELVFISTLSTILVLLGSKMMYFTKLLIMFAGVFSILILQAVKPAFRKQTWNAFNQENKLSVFTRILKQKISDPSSMFQDEQGMFTFYVRFNEGQIVSRVINAVPEKYPYANGETIYLSLAATLVPRFLWPDKPEAGGAANFERFVGIKLKGYSIGLSPFGEAYGNFGRSGAILFMFFFGLLYNLFFHWLLKISVSTPSIILWFPFLFFYPVQIESDIVTMVNSLTKFAFVAYVVYKFFPLIFKRQL